MRLRLPIIRKLLWVLGAFLVFGGVAFLCCFPGRQALLAFTLATGVGVNRLQAQVDRLESKAVQKQEFSQPEKQFLLDLYSCFAKGGALVAPQSSKMMHRYLSKTGEALAVRSDLFTRSAPVRKGMDELKKQVVAEWKRGTDLQTNYSSETFYMGDPEYFDSFVGLYFGRLQVRPCEVRRDSLVLSWRAEVPWSWPTYGEILQKHGDYHAQSFPLPNAKSLLMDSRYCLRMEDGLGGHLAAIGLAKPFLVYSEWQETLARDRQEGSEQADTADGSQPFRSETNRMSEPAGSRR
jgi:hypothetical protein